MTVEEARAKFGIGPGWRAVEFDDGKIMFNLYDDDIIIRPDGTAYELKWVMTNYGHDVRKYELTPEDT